MLASSLDYGCVQVDYCPALRGTLILAAMPELPEVETIVRALRPDVLDRTIVGLRNDWPRHLVGITAEELAASVTGRTIISLGRRGKYLVFTLGEGFHLVIHLRMSGHLSVVETDEPRSQYVHTTFELDDGRELRFRDTRKFGKVSLFRPGEPLLDHLGPEPLSELFDADLLGTILTARSRQLKALLLDQQMIAGLGNIYVDEALHLAKLHPVAKSDSLSPEEIAALHRAIRHVLQMGINNEGASIDSYRKPDGTVGAMQNAFKVYGRVGEPCIDCGTMIIRIKAAGRGTHLCPSCQPDG